MNDTAALMSGASADPFARALLDWYATHGRKHLPWQRPRTPYRVWLSEVMLQQTQVGTVIAYFERFVAVLPTIAALAAATEDQVMALWSGLGYYSRARNLHRTARWCVDANGGELPRAIDALAALPGIGRSTAAAILAQAFGDRHAILDGNVRRVLARWHGVRGWPGATATQRTLWAFADLHTPTVRVADYTQAIMDLGATLCARTRPACARCPVAFGCVARQEELVDELPEPRPRRARPLRETAMLVARDHRHRVLLERRAPTGVWARLWSLPEVATANEAAQHLRQRFAVRAGAGTPCAAFTHDFTHFRLHVTPIVFDDVAVADTVGDSTEHRWCSAGELAELGLPAPVRTLLEHLDKELP